MIKKIIVFMVISIFILLVISLVPIMFVDHVEEISTQSTEVYLQTDVVSESHTHQNVEVIVEVNQLDEGLIWLQQLISEPSFSLISSFISFSDIISNQPSAIFKIEVEKESISDFLSNMSLNMQVKEVKTYTDNETPRGERVDSWINNLSLQEQRYLELISEASELEDIIAIEKELSSIQAELEYWYLLQEQQNKIAVTISFYLSSDSISLWQSGIMNELMAQFNQITTCARVIVIKMIGCLPYLVLLITAIVLLRLVFKRHKR